MPRSDSKEVDDMWASLQDDLLLEVFRRLDATAVVSCCGVCKPWRRAIIRNAAACLRPRPDRFLPDLALGFFYHDGGASHALLRRVPGTGPTKPALPVAAAVGDEDVDTPASSFIPPAAGGGVDLAFYDNLVSSRDGFLLLGGRAVDNLCLCNPATGDCTFLPAAAAPDPYAYVVLTAYDRIFTRSGGDDDMAARILALAWNHIDRVVTYQIFDTTTTTTPPGAGAWGPINKTSPPELGAKDYTTCSFQGDVVVCGDGVLYWIAKLIGRWPWQNTCVLLAVDVRDNRTWTTKLPPPPPPEQCLLPQGSGHRQLVVATSGDDGRQLSVVVSLPFGQIQVWVLLTDKWTLRWPGAWHSNVYIRGFYARSGFVLGEVAGQGRRQKLLVHLDGAASPRHIGSISRECESGEPYGMDWSTYLSKMKCF